MKIIFFSCIFFIIGLIVGFNSMRSIKTIRIKPIQDGFTHHFYVQKVNPRWKIHGYKQLRTLEEIKIFNKKLEKGGFKQINPDKDKIGNNSVYIIDLDGVEFWYKDTTIDIFVDGEQLE